MPAPIESDRGVRATLSNDLKWTVTEVPDQAASQFGGILATITNLIMMDYGPDKGFAVVFVVNEVARRSGWTVESINPPDVKPGEIY